MWAGSGSPEGSHDDFGAGFFEVAGEVGEGEGGLFAEEEVDAYAGAGAGGCSCRALAEPFEAGRGDVVPG